MSSKLPKVFLVLIALVAIGLVVVRSARAAVNLNLDPGSTTVTKDSEFEVRVGINVEGNQAFGADVILGYSNDSLELVRVEKGDFFSDFSWATGGSTIEMHGYFSSLFDSKTGGGQFAKLVFKAKKDSGNATVGFACANDGSQTMILNTDGNNILSCSGLNQTTIEFSSQASQETNNDSGGQENTSATTPPESTVPPVATPKPKSKRTANPSSTPVVVTLSDYTPPPTPSEQPLDLTPVEDQVKAKGKANSIIIGFGVGAGVIALSIGVYFLVKKLKGGNDESPPQIKPNASSETTTFPVPPVTPPPPPRALIILPMSRRCNSSGSGGWILCCMYA